MGTLSRCLFHVYAHEFCTLASHCSGTHVALQVGRPGLPLLDPRLVSRLLVFRPIWRRLFRHSARRSFAQRAPLSAPADLCRPSSPHPPPPQGTGLQLFGGLFLSQAAGAALLAVVPGGRGGLSALLPHVERRPRTHGPGRHLLCSRLVVSGPRHLALWHCPRRHFHVSLPAGGTRLRPSRRQCSRLLQTRHLLSLQTEIYGSHCAVARNEMD